jgi:hypothetical protein
MEQLTTSALIALIISSAIGGVTIIIVNKIAELYGLWYQSLPTSLSYRELTPNDFEKLNRLQFEISFYLPKEIFGELTDVLSHPENHQAMNMFSRVRNYVTENISEEELGTIEEIDFAIW